MDSIPTSSSAATSATNSLDGRGVGGGGSDFLNLGMFGHPSGVGDLLLGSGGFGGSLGNGYGNESGGSNSVTSGGVAVSTGSSAFDLNDFPSLGGSGSSNGLAAALRQQQQQQQQQQQKQQQQQQQQALAHQQMLQGASTNSNTANLYRLAMQAGANGGPNFTMATEDFPALPGAPVGGGVNGLLVGQDSGLLLGANGISGLSLTGSGSSFGGAPVSRSAAAGGLYGGELENAGSQMDGGLLGGGGLGGLGGLQLGPSNQGPSLLQQRSTTLIAPGSSATGLPSAPGVTSVAGSALGGDFGLLGLLSVIRMTDADRNALALGTDLTMLGMNLNSGDNLYTNFASPWSEAPATKEPHYQVRLGLDKLSLDALGDA